MLAGVINTRSLLAELRKPWSRKEEKWNEKETGRSRRALLERFDRSIEMIGTATEGDATRLAHGSD